MKENVKMEVAFEIITMRIALAINNNNMEEVARLKGEREKLYEGNYEILKKVYEEYSKEVKLKIEGEKNG